MVHPTPGADRRSAVELAARTEATVERVRTLVEIGTLHPGVDGTFGTADVLRVRTVAAFVAAVEEEGALADVACQPLGRVALWNVAAPVSLFRAVGGAQAATPA